MSKDKHGLTLWGELRMEGEVSVDKREIRYEPLAFKEWVQLLMCPKMYFKPAQECQQPGCLRQEPAAQQPWQFFFPAFSRKVRPGGHLELLGSLFKFTTCFVWEDLFTTSPAFCPIVVLLFP